MQPAALKSENWGLFEPLRGLLGPILEIFKSFISPNVVITLLCLTIFVLWYRGSGTRDVGSVGYPRLSHSGRLIAYEEMWRKEESELWDWLEDRIGLDNIMLHKAPSSNGDGKRKSKKSASDEVLKERQKVLKGRDAEAKLREEKMEQREMEDMVRVADERLNVLKCVLDKRKANHKPEVDDE